MSAGFLSSASTAKMQLQGCEDPSQALPCVCVGCCELRGSVHCGPLGDIHVAKDKNTQNAPVQMETASQQHPEEGNDTEIEMQRPNQQLKVHSLGTRCCADIR